MMLQRSGLVVATWIFTTVACAGAEIDHGQRVAAVTAMPGLVAFWDFVAREPAGARRFVAHVPAAAPTDYPLDAGNYVREYWGEGKEASYADFPLAGRGPFGDAIRIRREEDPTFRPFLFVPRARLHDTPLDIKGDGRSVTVVVWAVRESGNHALAGIWHEGTDLKQDSTQGIRRVERGQRQYALFAGLNKEGSACGHVSENGASSFLNRYALHKCNSAGVASAVPADAPPAELAGGWHCFAMTFDHERHELTGWLDGKAGDRWLDAPQNDKLLSFAANAWLQGRLQRQEGMQEGEDPAFPAAQCYNPPEETPVAVEVVREQGDERIELREYPFTRVRVTLRRSSTGGWTEVGRDLTALRLNPWWYPHGIYSPADAASGGPFTIGRVIHSGRGVGFTGWIGGVAVFDRVLSAAELAGLAALAHTAADGAAARPSSSRHVSPAVTVELCEQGLADRDAWPAEPPAATETFTVPAFAVADLPAKYVDDGVRGERPSPSLLRLRATVDMPAGVQRFLIRARSAARLAVGGTLVAETPFAPKNGGDGSQHDTERLAAYDPGPGYRFAPGGEYEAVAEHETAGGPVEVVYEVFVGGREGKNPRRVEVGETVVAMMRAGSDAWNLLTPAGTALPYSDAAWEAYRAARAAEVMRLDAVARSAQRRHADSAWDARHAAARDWLAATPEVPVPDVPPGSDIRSPVDAFVVARLIEATRGREQSRADGIDFFRDVQPLLESRCLECHRGPRAKGGLRLDDARAALAGGDGGPVIVPRDAAGSELLRRVRSEDAADRMPPTGDRLTAEQTGLLARWITEGPQWPDIRVVRRDLAPPVDDLGFIRRVMLDTVGVPPTADEARRFVADTAPDKRTRLVDRLLADDRWADHWMPFWQDLLAENPNILNPTLNNTGPFRRWLHDCLLDDLPLDRMVTQLVRQQGSVVAGGPAGFGMASQNDAPYATKGMIVTAAFLGIDTKCARCHDSPAGAARQRQLFEIGAMLAGRPLDVPATSSVDPEKLRAGGRMPLIEVTLSPGTNVPPQWPFATTGAQRQGGAAAVEPTENPSSAASLPPSDDDVADQSAAPSAAAAMPKQDDRKPEPPVDMAVRDRLAAVLTAPENERFAEVAANRIWARFMGRGIVEPLDDWEKGRPTHPELLRWLARELVRSGYRTKRLARLVLTSAAYQRAVDPALAGPDPLFTAAEPRRLWAEQVVDTLIAATGKPVALERVCLDLNGRREIANAIDLGAASRGWMLASLSNERDRPSLALPRLQAVADVLAAFGWRGARQDPTSVRDAAPNALQPAILANGLLTSWLVRLSDDHPLTRLAIDASSPEALVEDLFLRLLTRQPTDGERRLHAEHLRSGFDRRVVPGARPLPREHAPPPLVTWTNHLQPEAGPRKESLRAAAQAGDPPTPQLDPEWRQRCEDLIWTLINAPEMLFRP